MSKTRTIAYIDANNVLVGGFAITREREYRETYYRGFDIFSYLNDLASKRGWGEIEFKYFDSTIPENFGRDEFSGDNKVKNAHNRTAFAEANGAELFMGKLKLKKLRAIDDEGRPIRVSKHVEKHTDAFMTTEIVADACMLQRPRQLIITDDADFFPPIVKARQMGADVFLVSTPEISRNKSNPNKDLSRQIEHGNLIRITPEDVANHLMPAPYRLRTGKSVFPKGEYIEIDSANVELLSQQAGNKPITNSQDWREKAIKKGLPDLTRW